MEGETAGVGTKLHVKGSGGNDGSIPGTSGMVATDVSRDGCGSTPKAPRRDVSATGRTLLVPGGLVWALVVMIQPVVPWTYHGQQLSTERVVATLDAATTGAVTGKGLCVPVRVGVKRGGAEVAGMGAG